MINFLPGIDSTAAALNAERIRMDVVSENIANADTTRGVDGKPYQREQVVFESVLRAQQDSDAAGSAPQTVAIARIEKDRRPPIMVYNPSHPDANSQGMVAMPDISVPEEMVDMISASRAFEANLAVVKNARTMAEQTLAIGKHS
jgi:flagellar basal-body rod protein FlgC